MDVRLRWRPDRRGAAGSLEGGKHDGQGAGPLMPGVVTLGAALGVALLALISILLLDIFEGRE